MKVKVAQSYPTLCNLMDYTGHRILQARILEWVSYPFSRGSSQPRNRTRVSYIGGGFFTNWAIREALILGLLYGFPCASVGEESICNVGYLGLIPGKNTGVCCHFLLQRIFLTQGSNPCLLHWQADSLPLSHLGNLYGVNKSNLSFSLLHKDNSCASIIC